MNRAVRIRPATAQDGAVLVEALGWAMAWRSGGGLPAEAVLADPAAARYVTGWPRDSDLGVVAERAGAGVGAAWLRRLPADDPGYGWVDGQTPELSIGLAPAERAQGTGTALVVRLLDRARSTGGRRVSLSVEGDNPAVRLYWRAGFRLAGAVGGAWTMLADLAPAEPAHRLVAAVRAELASAADPEKAEPMRAYLKSTLPMLGVPTPRRTALLRPLLAGHPIADPARWRATVLELWRAAAHREERYAALALARHKPYRAHLLREPVESLGLLDELVVTGAWWDLVDETATRLVGPLLLAHPELLTPVVRAWARDPDRWRRRTAVICQIGGRDRTDAALLAETVEATAADPDFFLRKGIGWALRQHARTDPEWVRSFVAAHELSPLSRREAVRHLGEGR